MNFYLLSLLIIVVCISLSESYEKRGKSSSRTRSKDASVSAALQNGRKFRKKRVKKPMQKQNATEGLKMDKTANKKIYRRKRVDKTSPKLRKKHKKIIVIANDQPMRSLPAKRGNRKGKLVKKRKERRRAKVAQNRQIADQRSNGGLNSKKSVLFEQPAKRHTSRQEQNLNKKMKKGYRTKIWRRKKKMNNINRNERLRIMPGKQQNDQPSTVKEIVIKKGDNGLRKLIDERKLHDATDQRNLNDETDSTTVPSKDKRTKVVSKRENRPNFHKKSKIVKEPLNDSKAIEGNNKSVTEALSTKKPESAIFIDDLRKVPTFNRNKVTVHPHPFFRRKVTGKKIIAKDGATLIKDDYGNYHWGETFGISGPSIDSYYSWKKHIAIALKRYERIKNSNQTTENPLDGREGDPPEQFCDRLPNGKCKVTYERKCIKKFGNGDCKEGMKTYYVIDLKTGESEPLSLQTEKVTYPPPPSKEEILKREKERYHNRHCRLNSKQCVAIFEIVYKESNAMEGLLDLHIQRLSDVGRLTDHYDTEYKKRRGAGDVLEQLYIENEDRSCQFVADVFPSLKPYFATYAENCQF